MGIFRNESEITMNTLEIERAQRGRTDETAAKLGRGTLFQKQPFSIENPFDIPSLAPFVLMRH